MNDDTTIDDDISADDLLESSRPGNTQAENTDNGKGIHSDAMSDKADHISPAGSKNSAAPLDDPQSDSNVDSTELYQEGMLDATHDFALPSSDDDDEPEDIILREPGE